MLNRGEFLLVLLGGSMLCLAGCGHDARPRASCEALIPENRLPEGWTLLPTSEMPPSDKMPWWTENPLLLEGAGTKQLELEGKPIAASRVLAAIYVNDVYDVTIFCLSYDTCEAALADYEIFQGGHLPDNGMLGLSQIDDHIIVLMSLSPEAPDRQFFVEHFESMATPQ